LEQSSALDILKTGSNVFLTGSAGTGKTYVLNQYISYLKEREVPVAITASTGIAATHIGGQTIHSWSGVGIKEEITRAHLSTLEKNIQLAKRIRNTEVLVIDEISMISGKILKGVDTILQFFKDSSLPFGGIQLILSGDFFQLPPVFKYEVPARDKFVFMSPTWVEANLQVCYLTKQYRQKESELNEILKSIRARNINLQTIEQLKGANKQDTSVRLYTHNADVDQINREMLSNLEGKESRYEAKTNGNNKLTQSLSQNVMAPKELILKEGARVMFVKNNPEKGYFNGSLGRVTGKSTDGKYPKVTLDSGPTIIARQEEWSVTDENDKILASYQQIPLRLAWAITIHKSQGMTLDEAEIDLSKTFEKGQGYVALSRLKSLEGLNLQGLNEVALQVDDLAFKADKRFQELSADNEQNLKITEKEQIVISHMDFIEKCGGTNDEITIEKNKGKQKERVTEPVKESTFQKTMKMVVEGKSIAEIAFDRDLTEGTIIGHLEKILEDQPSLDISALKPENHKVKKVSKVIEKLKSQGNEEYLDSAGNVKLGVIHRSLNGQMDFEEIRLCRIFVD